MNKKYISLLLVILLLIGFLGCGRDEKKEELTTTTEKTVIFSNYYISFSHPEGFISEGEDESDSFRSLHKNNISYFVFYLIEKEGTLDEEKDIFIEDYDGPEENFGFDKEEELIVDGKPARFITFGNPGHRISFLLADYSDEYFVIFNFYFSEGGNEEQFARNIIESIKFK